MIKAFSLWFAAAASRGGVCWLLERSVVHSILKHVAFWRFLNRWESWKYPKVLFLMFKNKVVGYWFVAKAAVMEWLASPGLQNKPRAIGSSWWLPQNRNNIGSIYTMKVTFRYSLRPREVFYLSGPRDPWRDCKLQHRLSPRVGPRIPGRLEIRFVGAEWWRSLPLTLRS